MSTDSHLIASVEGNETATAGHKGDFFSMFFLPSSQSYEEDVHLSTSSYTPSFQGAASAVMGGILSVIDTALAVLNEEFDNPSDSIISDSSKYDNDDGLPESRESFASSDRSVIGCCRHTAHPKMSTSASNEKKASENSKQSVKHESENNAHNLNMSESIEQSDPQEKDYFTPQNSLIGSISTLQLFEEDPDEIMKKLISDQHTKSINDFDTQRETDNIFNDFVVPESEIIKQEESEYCIVHNESETNDGWLVVSED